MIKSPLWDNIRRRDLLLINCLVFNIHTSIVSSYHVEMWKRRRDLLLINYLVFNIHTSIMSSYHVEMWKRRRDLLLISCLVFNTYNLTKCSHHVKIWKLLLYFLVYFINWKSGRCQILKYVNKICLSDTISAH